MEFGNIWVLLHLFWVLPLCGICVYFAFSKRASVMKQIFGPNYNSPQCSTVSKTKRYIKIWLFIFSIFFLFLAIAQPRWGWKILPYSGKGRDLMILLDVSKSMNAQDVKPTRLKHAKFFLRNLIKQSPGDRFGLIAFAGSAFLECPLTVDKTSLFQALDEIKTDSIPLGGTNIEKALDTAIEAFKAAEGGHRAIILLTDGDEIDGNSKNAIKKLNEMKIPLFVVGIGDPNGNGLIQTTDEQGNKVLLRDRYGKLVKSHLNESRLKLLKEKTNGIYIRSIETNSGLKPILKRIKALVPKGYANGYNKRPIERFQYPLFIAVLLLLCFLGISEKRKTNKPQKNAAQTVSLILLLFLFVNTIQAQQIQQPNLSGLGAPRPNTLQVEDKIDDADSKENDPALAKADKLTNPVDLYNEALKMQHEKNNDGAKILYKKAIRLSDKMPEVRGKAFQNLGVISHQEARTQIFSAPDKALEILDKAEALYRESMRSDSHLKKVVLNQQRLLDDRVRAKNVKAQKEKMKKQQEEAKKKTKEALKQQQKENQQKQKKQQQNKQSKGQQGKKDQEQDKQQGKKAQDKKEQKKKDQNQNEQKKTEQKINEAKKAVNDLKKQAQKLNDKKMEQQASQAEKELKKAQEEHKKGNGDKSEDHIQKALKKIKPKANKKKQEQNKNAKGQQGKKSKKEDKKKGKKGQNKSKKLDKGNPQDKQVKKKDAEKAEKIKDIDPKQAEALLKMMAEDEQKLRDKLKESQKRQAQTRKPLKDW